MGTNQAGNRLFSQEEDFGKELWDLVERMPRSTVAADPSCGKGKLHEQYLFLKEFLTWNVFTDQNPITLLDDHGQPLIQDVYALRHHDRELVRDILYGETTKQICFGPKPVFYYRLRPDDCFALYDAPFLMYLYAKHASQPGRRTLRMKDFPLCYCQIFSDTKNKQARTKCFGVTIQETGKRDDGNVISVPVLCEIGRLEAFQRFILCRGRALRVHTFQYLTRLLPYHETLESVPDFEEEDAWYFEMCSGLSLVSEITALLVELEIDPPIDPSDIKKDADAMAKWSACRLGIIGELLREHRECIINCPAIYWRASSLRNVIRQTDHQFMVKELEWERQIKLAYPEDPAEPCLKTVGTWRALAKEQFDRYFFTDLSRILVCSEEFWWEQLKKRMGVKGSEDVPYKPVYPEASAFMSAAENMVMNRLCTGVERSKRAAMQDAVVDPYTAGMQNNGFYFRGCLPKKDPVIEKMIKTARKQSQAVDDTNTAKGHLEKLRNTNRHEEIFEFIHQTLYGDDTNSDSGFFQPEAL